MIPEQSINITKLKEKNQPSRTYQLDFEKKRVIAMIDGRESIVQAVKKILYTERYAYVIYSSQYGVELNRLIGQDYDFIASDIKRTLEEALLVDNRITGLSDFKIEKIGLDKLSVSFMVHSIEGSTNINAEVIIA